MYFLFCTTRPSKKVFYWANEPSIPHVDTHVETSSTFPFWAEPYPTQEACHRCPVRPTFSSPRHPSPVPLSCSFCSSFCSLSCDFYATCPTARSLHRPVLHCPSNAAKTYGYFHARVPLNHHRCLDPFLCMSWTNQHGVSFPRPPHRKAKNVVGELDAWAVLVLRHHFRPPFLSSLLQQMPGPIFVARSVPRLTPVPERISVSHTCWNSFECCSFVCQYSWNVLVARHWCRWGVVCCETIHPKRLKKIH